jgi:signal transduction histidine kinase
MRVTPALAAVPLLLVLLTWLSVRALNEDAERFDRALAAIDRFTMLENALDRDALLARAGMLRNYDPLVRQGNQLSEAVGRLRDRTPKSEDEIAAIDRLAISLGEQDALVERFKSDNALLQNSLIYFQLFCSRLFAANREGVLGPAIVSLAAGMLQLTLDTSPAAAGVVETRLDQLAALPAPPGQAEAVHALLAHGRLLHDLLPATDGALKALFALPIKPQEDAVRTIILEHQRASRETARDFRRVLSATSLLLLALLIHLGMQLRARARAQRRRAAFEHVLAGISMRFVNAPAQDVGTQIQLALVEMAECVGADRAYFMSSGASTEIRTWCRPGLSVAPDWSDQVLALRARFAPKSGGVIHIPDASRLPPGADRDAFVAAGLQGWACVSATGADDVGMVLGFDALRRTCRITRAGELGLLPTALDTIANAIRRQSLERERGRLEARLHQARRMETVGALASGIAHNFNNIVGAIVGYAEMAEAYVAADSRPARNLGEIRHAADRARDLVDQILAFGRRREIGRVPMSVKALVDEAASLLRASLPSAIELVVGAVPESAIVSGEPGQLQQVLLNLCNNAAQAVDEVGRIEIESELQVVARRRSSGPGELAPGRYVRIAVSDAGSGMDDATIARIFEPFFTTRASGNGLGLATVREIVREHDGVMKVWSALDVGSRFEVWLPCIEAPASSMKPSMKPSLASSLGQETPRLPPRGRGETVMVVDDESERLLRDEEILAALGYEPVGFLRASDAIAACRAAPGRFDAMVVGHLASSATALAVATALHGVAPAPILLATGSAGAFGAETLMEAGIFEIVRRPLNIAEIAASLARGLAVSGNSRHATAVTHLAAAEILS